MVFVVPIIIFAVGLANATVSLKKRLQLVRRLLAVTKESDPALRELSEQWQMTIRVLPIEEYACMTVGVLRPIVILSSGAIERLSAQELRAVLLHEQVHVKRKDTLWATLSRFVSDCSFRCSPQAEEIARRTREITADQEASRNIDPRVLASVLVKFARHAPSISYAFAESFASPATISERVERLVDGGSDLHEGQSTSKIMIQVGLASTLILYPYIVRLIAALWLHC
jgi:Zn-dependent protease with chaperone function